MQFIATDDNFGAASIKLYLCSHDGSGEGFLGTASEYSKSDKKAKEILKKITEHKNSVEVLVESIQAGKDSGDKLFRIVGTYEQTK